MKRLLLLAIAVSLLAPLSASAGHYSDMYVIPVVAHTTGVNGTNWRSDVAIHNFNTTELEVSMVFIEGGLPNTDNVIPLPMGSVMVPAMGNVIINDVLEGMDADIGALIVGADLPFAVTSRAYSMSPSGDTIGQTVPPAAEFLEQSVGNTDNSAATAYIPGLISNSTYRTNLGFVAGTSNLSEPLTIEFTIRGANGNVLGVRGFQVDPGSYVQLQFPVTSVTATPFNEGSATVRITSGDGEVVPYASVIDNRTADAVFITGQFPENMPFAKRAVDGAFRMLVSSPK